MLFFRKVWKLASELHPAFWVVPSFIAGVLVALLVNADDKITPAVISLLGVMIGGALTAAVGLAVAITAQRAQLTTSIWPQRLKVH
jgi:ABC-type nitrate/sulfonate/bicarbonate transport system permease component